MLKNLRKSTETMAKVTRKKVKSLYKFYRVGLFTVVVALGNINLLSPEIIHTSPTLQWNAIMLVQRIKIAFTCHDILTFL